MNTVVQDVPLLSALLDYCGHGVLTVDPESLTVRYANAEAAALLETEPAALPGTPVSEFEIGIEDFFYWEEVRAGRGADMPDCEGVYRSRKGLTRPVRKAVHRRRIAGEVVYVITVRDNSAEKAAEDLAIRNASLLAATFESSTSGLLVTDPLGTAQNFNRRLVSLFGLPSDIGIAPGSAVVLGALRARLLDPGYWDSLVAQARREPESVIQYQIRLVDGRHLVGSAAPQRLRGRAIGRVWAFCDDTERVAAEHLLAQARAEADAAATARSSLLAGMLQTLRPLCHAVGQAVSDPDLAPRVAAAHALLDDVEALVAADTSTDISGQADCTRAAAEAVALHTPMLQRSAVQIDSRMPEGLTVPGAQRVLVGILDRALRFARSRSLPGGRISLAAYAMSEGGAGRRIRIELADEGTPVPREALAQLFDPAPRTAGGGTEHPGGFDLAIARAWTARIGGRCGADSDGHRGCRLWFEFPAA